VQRGSATPRGLGSCPFRRRPLPNLAFGAQRTLGPNLGHGSGTAVCVLVQQFAPCGTNGTNSTATYDIVQPGTNLELPQGLFVETERRLAGRRLGLRHCHLSVAHVFSPLQQRGPSNRCAATLAQRLRRDRDAGHRPQPNPTFRDGHHNAERESADGLSVPNPIRGTLMGEFSQ
jgi:hypothetical protein